MAKIVKVIKRKFKYIIESKTYILNILLKRVVGILLLF